LSKQDDVDVTYKFDPAASPQEELGTYVSLLFTWHGGAHALALREGQAVVIGRAAPAELVIEHRSLSRVHARVSLCSGKPLLEDLNSTNGCLLNGKSVRSAFIDVDDVARLGAIDVRVCGVVTHSDGDCASTLALKGAPLPFETEDEVALIVVSPLMKRLYNVVARAATTTLPVLVQGPTGSGKELVARRLHERSGRKRGPFKALNCAALPATLLESILFGHERGAFTGADRQSKGVFEQAEGGTVFLDEIGELSAPAQAALLRVLDQRTIIRVGGTEETEVDARIVAATHRDLASMVRAGTFREDLMFRLDALTLTVAPLRERCEEIIPLAQLFLQRARAQWRRSAERFSDPTSEALLAYGWPGNVRQLKNVVERAVVLCSGAVIELEHLPHQISRRASSTASDAAAAPTPADAATLVTCVREFEIGMIRDALTKTNGNQAQAARILGLPRRTLASKAQAYGLL
jgi:DNA-binding NtrC family response regulator